MADLTVVIDDSSLVIEMDTISSSSADCPQVTVTDTDGNELGTVPAGDTFEVGNTTVNKSDGSLLQSVLAEGSYNVPDSTITNTDGDSLGTVMATETFEVADTLVNKSDGSLIQAVLAEGSYNVPDSPIINTAAASIGSVKATETYTIANVDWTDTDGSPQSTPYGDTIECSAPDRAAIIASATCEELNANLSQAQRNVVQCVNPPKDGQTTSIYTGDAGDERAGRLVDFFTLDCNSPQGTTDRFYIDPLNTGVLYDYGTGLMWSVAPLAAANLQNQFNAIAASTLGGFTDWRMPNVNEVFSVVNWEMGNPFNYAPWNFNTASGSTTFYWLSNFRPGATSSRLLLTIFSGSLGVGIGNTANVFSSYKTLMVRNIS